MHNSRVDIAMTIKYALCSPINDVLWRYRKQSTAPGNNSCWKTWNNSNMIITCAAEEPLNSPNQANICNSLHVSKLKTQKLKLLLTRLARHMLELGGRYERLLYDQNKLEAFSLKVSPWHSWWLPFFFPVLKFRSAIVLKPLTLTLKPQIYYAFRCQHSWQLIWRSHLCWHLGHVPSTLPKSRFRLKLCC